MLLVIVSLLLVTLSSLCNGLSVYLHIGPHKTGSTSVQKFANRYRKELVQRKICIPFSTTPPYQNKLLSRAIVALSTTGNITLAKAVVDSCVNHPIKYEKIFFSAENLSVLKKNQLQLFYGLFPKGTKFTIMLAYREWLSKMYSQYTQVTKMNILQAAPIGEYLFQNYGYIDLNTRSKDLSLNFLQITRNFEEVFGVENLHIVDYLGVQKKPKDLTHVYFCEIMLVLCNYTQALNLQPIYYNTKPDGQYIHAVSLVREYIYLQNYLIKKQLPKFFARDLVFNYSAAAIPFPIRRSNLKLLHEYAKSLDRDVRGIYETRMLYANQTATLEAMETLEAIEIDTFQFFSKPRWIQWLESQFQ